MNMTYEHDIFIVVGAPISVGARGSCPIWPIVNPALNLNECVGCVWKRKKVSILKGMIPWKLLNLTVNVDVRYFEGSNLSV